MLRYALRLDVDVNWTDRVSKWCSSNADGFIVAFEAAGDNLHIHAILDSPKSITQLRQALTRAFPERVGNKGYSLKVCDDNYDAYIRYICKGESKEEGPQIWCRQGLLYTDDHIQRAHEMYWVNNESLVANASKRCKVEKESVIDQVEKEAKERKLKSYDRVEVAKIYCRMFRDARKPINIYAARGVVNTVCLLLDDCNEDYLATKIADL
jgi:hypothetical protein